MTIELDTALDELDVARQDDLQAVLATVNIFDDTAAGIASAQPYFSVPSALTTGYLDLYKNVAGFPELKKTYPSAELVQLVSSMVNAVIQQAVSAGVLVSVTDAAGNSTWLQANDIDGGPTNWAAQMLTKSLIPSLVPQAVVDAITSAVMAAAGISNPDAANYLFAVTDQAGNLAWNAARRSDGGPEDWVIDMLRTRLASGALPDVEYHHPEALRSVRLHLAQIKAVDGVTARLNIGFIGDSYTAGHLYYLNKLNRAMAVDYGFGGPGYIGFNHGAALGNTNFQYSQSDPAFFGGAWVVAPLGTASPDNRSITSTAVGDYVGINAIDSTGISTAITAGKLLYLGNGSSFTVRYRWADAAPWETLTFGGTGPQEIAFPVIPAGAGWKFRLETVTGTPTLFGVHLINAQAGVCISKLAASGSTSGNWYNAADAAWRTQWKAAMSLIPQDAYFVMLGANDQGFSVTPAQYLANMQGLVGMIREIAPGKDIHLCMQAETPRASTYPISDYGKLLKAWAYSEGIPCSDLQYTFGKDVAQYSSTGNFPLIDADKLHPIIPTGGRLITEFFYRLLRFSC